MKGISFKFICIAIIFAPYLCFANGLEVSPMRLTIPSGQTNTSFKINNSSDESALFHIKAVKWSQQNGEDIYTETKDLIINPPIVNVNPDSYQLVRVGLRAPLNPNKEHTYRIFTTEVSTRKNNPENNSTQLEIETLFEFRLPLFVQPLEVEKDLDVYLKKINQDKTQLKIKNDSNMHIQVVGVAIEDEDQEVLYSEKTFVYLLPQQEKTWIYSIKNLDDMDDIILKLQTDWGPIVKTGKDIS